MVKLNSKITNKFKTPLVKNKRGSTSSLSNGSQGSAQEIQMTFRLKLMKRLSTELLNSTLNTQKECFKYVHVSMWNIVDIMRKSDNDIDKAVEFLTAEFTSKYDLYLDDERLPDSEETPNIGNCVVVRSVSAAKEVVEKLGCPAFMHLDFCLHYSQVSTPFVDWFIERYTPRHSGLNENFGFHVHSLSSEGKRLLNRKLISFERLIWERTEQDLEQDASTQTHQVS